jgi:hypothetical protein
VTGRRGRRHRKLLDDLKESRGYSHKEEEALDRTMWRASLGETLDLSLDYEMKLNTTYMSHKIAYKVRPAFHSRLGLSGNLQSGSGNGPC